MVLFLACNPDFWGSAAEAKEVRAEETYSLLCSMQRYNITVGNFVRAPLCLALLTSVLLQGLERLCSVVRTRDSGQATELMQSPFWTKLLANLSSAT